MLLFERFLKHLELTPRKHILADDTVPDGITIEKLWTLSGRVQSWIKNQGLGAEDFVMICLPRGIQPIIAEFGIWRSGAAFVLVEDTYAPERIRFIRENCACKAVIDSAAWEEIQKLQPAEGYVESDPHTAAFAVYTSGTTGNPKGVVHEYGNIERMIHSFTLKNGERLAQDDDRFALVAPLNFVASVLIELCGFVYGVFNYVVSYATTKSPMAIGLFIIKNRITGTFLTPSYIRKMKTKPPMLKFCIIGSEPANGIYLDGLTIHNFYLMSESGFAVCHFKLDKRYEETPVGKSEFDHEVLLLGEDGQPVADGEEGEICFENEFCRGYIGLPEENAKAFVNGFYHTGDLGKKEDTGNIVICGRLNDMVKVNGNRVEPGEIENTLKKVANLSNAAVRIFNTKDRVFIAAYYTDNVKLDYEETLKKLSEYLPYYMLPSFLIHLDALPVTATGKLNRKALPEPDFSSFQDTYTAPRDELETLLCDSFAKVLEMQRVGIHDDFYQMGGDSMSAMEVLVESRLPGLSAADVFKGRTPEKIAEIYRASGHSMDEKPLDEQEEDARKIPHRLMPYQTYMIDYQLYTPLSTMYNLFMMARLDPKIYNIRKMAQAMHTVILNHPALFTRFYFNEDGEIMQEYYPDYDVEIKVEKISEFELRTLKDGLVAPYKIMDSRLFRVHVYETEKAGYVFFDVHHTIFDGTSFTVLMQDMIKAYYDTELDKDYYFATLANREKAMEGPRYREDQKYFESLYDGREYSGRPAVDFNVRENTLDHYSLSLESQDEGLTVIENRYKIGRNAFFSLVSLLSIAIYNKADDVMISWTYNGRDDVNKLSQFGLLLRDLPLALHLTKSMLVKDMYESIAGQIAGGIEHSSYPYTTQDAGVALDDMVCFLYQQDIRNGGADLDEMGIQLMDVRQNNAASENAVDVQILDGSDGLSLMIDYTASFYKKESIERFARIFTAVTDALIKNADKENENLGRLLHEAMWKVHEDTLFISWMKYEDRDN